MHLHSIFFTRDCYRNFCGFILILLIKTEKNQLIRHPVCQAKKNAVKNAITRRLLFFCFNSVFKVDFYKNTQYN